VTVVFASHVVPESVTVTVCVVLAAAGVVIPNITKPALKRATSIDRRRRTCGDREVLMP